MPEPRSSESSKPPLPPSWPEWKDWIGKRGWWLTPLARIEWASEWVYYGLRSLALFDLLELAGRAAVLVVVIVWFLETDDRTRERHYRAWELINAARGSTGDGGRRDALQDLNKDGVWLVAAPLEKAYLFDVDLKGAVLDYANLQGADLMSADLQDAHLFGANLQGADLTGADLRGAVLTGVNLQGAILAEANLKGAGIWHVNLQGASLWAANLQGADLMGADLRGAKLRRANLQGARLTQEQLDVANGDTDTQLPEGLTRPAHWSKAEGNEGPPTAQPDAAEGAPAASGAPGPGK